MTAALLASLGNPACFPHRPAAVEIVQTHMSIVCLAGELVYKLKKAVTFPFADFSRLSVRRRLCREEVRLNRRLCPDTYLGTAALRRTAAGGVAFSALGDDEGPGDLDVAVVMRRLPAQRMLDELVRHRAVCPAEIEALARHVAAFHARADRGPEVVRLADPHRLAASPMEARTSPRSLWPRCWTARARSHGDAGAPSGTSPRALLDLAFNRSGKVPREGKGKDTARGRRGLP
ncbi:MAG TPA: hypothetical protein VFD82_09470 [Planctomycetota bacterium]|nr:hypothetical protein [Planctomycetota bacterium]